MKRNILMATVIALLSLLGTAVFAQDADPVEPGQGHGNGVCQFIDEDGDGFNDLAPDADGDGIPNGLDPDYVRPEDGTGSQNRLQNQMGFLFDVFGRGFGGIALQRPVDGGHMFGPGDGSGTSFGPMDGTGFGPGTGDNPGDGVGPGNSQGRRGGQQ